jgi:DNA-binding response OmpR family regulator
VGSRSHTSARGCRYSRDFSTSRNALRTILLVDDEPTITSTIEAILIPQGFRVLVTQSASEALALARTEPVHLIVSDVHMPGLPGPELLAELNARGISVPVLFISGDLAVSTVSRSLEVERASFLPKPFSAAELLRAVWSKLAE